MLNMVDLKKRPAILFERSGLATAFASTVSLLANPSSHLRIANKRLSAGLSLFWSLNPFRHVFNRLFLEFGRSLFQRYLVRCRGEILRCQSTWSIERFSNASRPNDENGRSPKTGMTSVVNLLRTSAI